VCACVLEATESKRLFTLIIGVWSDAMEVITGIAVAVIIIVLLWKWFNSTLLMIL
jgi:hypothetical protein